MSAGVPASAALAFLLSAPAINPVVLVSTAVAFPDAPQMVAARFAASLAVAVVMGLGWAHLGRPEWLTPAVLMRPGPDSATPERSRWTVFTETARHDFLAAGGFLVLGALFSSVLHVLVPAGVYEQLGGRLVLAVLVMALLAVVLALCSEADAFVAASFSSLPLLPRLVFLVVGPAVDVKLFALQAGTFGRRFALRFAPATLVVAVALRLRGRRTRAVGVLVSRGVLVRRETANVLLLLLGGVLVRIALDGTAVRYVRPSMQPGLVVAGAVLVGLAVLAVVRDLRAGPTGGDPGPAHGHRRRVSSSWLLALPILALVLAAPPALGVASVAVSDGRSSAPAQPTDALAADQPVLRLSDLVQQAVWDRTGSLDGRSVTVTGFVVDHPGGGLDLARIVITCCAADAHPVRIRLAGQVPSAAPGDWLAVTGTVVPGTATVQTQFVPTLTVTASRPVAVPAEQYEY